MKYGQFGKPCVVLEDMKEWRADVLAGRVQEADGAYGTQSKADFAAFFDGPVRTSFYKGYETVESSWKRIVSVESATDFKATRIKGLNGMTGFGYVGDLGEYPGMKRTFRPEASLVVDTYGGVYRITRQAIRNDESRQILQSTPQEMGEAAGIFVTELVLAMIQANPTAPDGLPFYSSARGNEVAEALDSTSLIKGVAWLGQQKNDDGRPIRVRTQTLLVQNEIIAAKARVILSSQQVLQGSVAGGTSAFGMGTANAAAGLLPTDAILVDPFLTAANDWYLFADPNRVPAFSVGFLDGQERPFIGLKDGYVRSVYGADVDPYTFEEDSLDYKTRLDVGAAPVDPRGTYRSRPA